MTLRLKTKSGMNAVLLSFIIAFITALCMFMPFLILDKGFFTYCGDYNSQQIPFNVYLQNFVKTQNGTWSWATDLGGSVINSYSFYNLGSPFFWLSTLLPNNAIPYLMVPNLILKFACIAAFSCLYLQRYAKTRNAAVIVSVLYAFSGFNIYNIFFNHMHEPVVIFPLMLWALDEFVLERRRGPFALMVAVSLLNNYFFFIGNVVFIIIYFFVKLATGEYRINAKSFFTLVFEAVLGVGIAMVLALPSFLCLIQNPRVDNFSDGFGLVMYGKVQQYFAIFHSAFFPPDSPYSPNLFTEGAIKWTSMSAFLPFISMSGVIAFMKVKRKSSTIIIIIICTIMAFVPILNSAFYAFNSSYYARWYYMPILFLCLATMKSLEDESIDLEKGAKITLIITGLFALFGFLPKKIEEGIKIGVAEYASQFWLTILLSLISLLVFYIFVRLYRNRPTFTRKVLAGVLFVGVFYSTIHMAIAKLPQWERDTNYKEYMYSTLKNMELPRNEGFYRIDAYEIPFDNVGLWMNQSCLHTFNSVVTPSIMEFYPLADVKRDVSSKPDYDKYYLRALLNTKYMIILQEKVEEFLELEYYEDWFIIIEEGDFAVFENPHFLPLGFTYDKYMLMENYEEEKAAARERALLEAIILTDEQAEKYGHLFSGQIENASSYKTVNHMLGLSEERRAFSSYETSADATGFSCKISLNKENLVFFSVPFDEGFSATVNGKNAEVLKVSGGLMAVSAPAGNNEIIFTYETPGFKTGKAISFLSLAVFAGYLISCTLWRRRVFIIRSAKK